MVARSSVIASSLLGLIALLPAAGVQAGEAVPCPDKKAGQWYRFAKTDLYSRTTEVLLKIDSVDGDRLIQNRGTFVTDRMFNWHKLDGREAKPKFYTSIDCPFALGETRVYKDVDYDGTMPGTKPRATFTVAVDPDLVPLTVKAGTFKVVRIVSENNWSTGSYTGKARNFSWYAPEIGVSVKTRFEATVPDPVSGSSQRVVDVFELLEYSTGN